MNRLIRIIIGCMCVLASGEVQAFDMFTVGAQWVELLGSLGGNGQYTSWKSTVYIDSVETIEGEECLKVMEKGEEGDSRFMTYLKTTGDKVWFMNNTDTQEWSLLYDFGLQSGEATTVATASFPTSSSSIPIEYEVVCVGIESDYDNSGIERMKIEVYDKDEYDSVSDQELEPIQEGYWLKGIGSETGLIFNVYFEMIGLDSKLISASTPADGVIYRDKAAGVSEVSVESIKDDSAYDMLGRKIEKPVAGQMYIQGGKLKIER